MTETITLPAYRAMTDDDLAVMLTDAEDQAFAAIVAELKRRDRAERRKKAEHAIYDEWYEAMHAQRMAAEEYTRGYLLNPEAKRLNAIAEESGRVAVSEWQLWTGPQSLVDRYGSDEIKDFFMFVSPRLTFAEYKRQRSTAGRIHREQWRDRYDQDGSEGNDERTADGPELADDEPGALRHGTPASETPEGGQRGTVDSGRPAPVTAEDITEDNRAGRAGRTVRPGLGRRERDNMTITEDHAGASGPAERDDDRDSTGDLKFILDETAAFVGKHVAATPGQVDAITLYAAATYALHVFPTFGRMLFTSEQEASGKTVAMMVTAALSANPLDASGTSYALQAALAAASNAPEQLTPTLYYDEISSVFGRSGLTASRDPIAEILRKGYKAGATRAWSVNRTSEPYSIYTPFLMAGLRNAVPRDIRSRCITLVMRPGTPAAYFDAREAEPEARALAACLGQAVASKIRAIGRFRARGIHPRLRDRHLEVWESLFAVAHVLGGQEWLNRCLAAFRELSLAEADQVTLSPRQETIRDVAGIAAQTGSTHVLADGTGFIGGLVIVDELRRLDNPRYRGRSEAGLALLVSDALPMNTVQLRIGGERVRGYYVADITAAWDRIRPAGPEDAQIPEEVNPFDVTDTDEDISVDAISAGQHATQNVFAGQHDVTFGTPDFEAVP